MMSTSYLINEEKETLIVPVKCENERGTAFFISENQLLTARHVVRGHFASQESTTPIYITIKGKNVLCSAEDLKKSTENVDLALLTIVDRETPTQTLFLSLLKDEFVKDLELFVSGYPYEVALGNELIRLKVKNRFEIKVPIWNDRALVVEDNLKLKLYDGLSGSPVLNVHNEVVGIILLQTSSTLEYLSVNKFSNVLNEKNITYKDDWQHEDTTTFGVGRAMQMCEDTITSISGRYTSKLHQVNEELESTLDYFCNKKALQESRSKLDKLVNVLCGFIPSSKSNLEKRFNVRIDKKSLQLENYNNLHILYKNINQKNALSGILNGIEQKTLKLILSELDVKDFKRVKFSDEQNLCIRGSAGTGKTHSLCHFSKNNQATANIYLFLGTNFSQQKNPIEFIKDKICQDGGFQDLNTRMVHEKRFAIIVIDAINEGVGCFYWNDNLYSLRTELNKYDSIKLIVSVRKPFDQEIGDINHSNWNIFFTEGFTLIREAIKTYYTAYNIDYIPDQNQIEAFKNPLFLKMFCETYPSLSDAERKKPTKRTIYHKYVEKKNKEISQFIDEDPQINITDKYLSKLANYSVFYGHYDQVPRTKARQYARRLSPNRFWSKDLLHACLSTSILLEDILPTNESSVMFEFENLGDYYKAEQLANSKKSVSSLFDSLLQDFNFFKRNNSLSPIKFKNTIKALFSYWHDEGISLKDEKKLLNPFLYELYLEYLNESNLTFDEYFSYLKEVNPQIFDFQNIIKNFKYTSRNDILAFHGALRLMESISKRDLAWTQYINSMYLLEKDTFLQRYSVETLKESSDDTYKFLVIITWMLSTSHPAFRVKIIRKLFHIFEISPQYIKQLIDLFFDVNDPYILSGLYCAVCGFIMVSRDSEFVTDIAQLVYDKHYSNDAAVPQDLIVRQWTLKIIERASYLNKECALWEKITPPFHNLPIDSDAIDAYDNIKEDFFGKERGSQMLFYSMFKESDFNRYIIGTNSWSKSRDYFNKKGEHKFIGVDLTQILSEMAYYIKDVFKWNDQLGALDNGLYSKGRFDNELERIGKKYQWLAWYRVNARLMDTCCVSRIYHKDEEITKSEIVKSPYPWNTRQVSRFDPTINVESYKNFKINFSGIDTQSFSKEVKLHWIDNDDFVPKFRYEIFDQSGAPFVLLTGYDVSNNADEQELFLFSNAAFVREKDTQAFSDWASKQDFYGRWMPERGGNTEFLWNDYPWADSYKQILEDYSLWSKPSDCPINMMLSYESQLQEDWKGINSEDEFLAEVYMPCKEIMEDLGLYCSEVRGVIKFISNNEVAAINIPQKNNTGLYGLFIRKDTLIEFLKQNKYSMFYYVLGEKTNKDLSGYVIKQLSASYQYKSNGELCEIQPMHVIKENKNLVDSENKYKSSYEEFSASCLEDDLDTNENTEK